MKGTKAHQGYSKHKTRIGVFAQGQILRISPNGLQTHWPLWCPPPPYEFRSHFSPFQINTQLSFYFTKWLPAAILDDRKSLLIAFLVISDQYTTFFSHKMAANGHFGWPKITFDHISRHIRSIRNFYILFTKWLPAAILDNRKSLSITFLAISDQYATLWFF